MLHADADAPAEAAEAEVAAAPAAPPGFVRLSKAEKKAQRAARLIAKRHDWRKRSKQAARERTQVRRDERAERLNAMSEEERQAVIEAEHAAKAEKARLHEAEKARVETAYTSGLRVAVDLSYGEMMSAKEQSSLSRQLARCWGANRRAQRPVSLHFAGMAACPPSCLPHTGEHKNWRVHFVEEDVATRFRADELVLLSPDADEVLTELDMAKVYVIGGLVDCSVKKKATLTKAGQIGARAMRLPLREYAPDLLNGRLPLTLPAVFDILLHVHATADWPASLKAALPQRQFSRPREETRSGRRAATREKRLGIWNAAASGGRKGGAGTSSDGASAEESGAAAVCADADSNVDDPERERWDEQESDGDDDGRAAADGDSAESDEAG